MHRLRTTSAQPRCSSVRRGSLRGRRFVRLHGSGLLLGASLLAACGGGRLGPEPQVVGASLTVYDPYGQTEVCEVARSDCPPATRNRKFLDACGLAGYRIVRCGCESRCTGRVLEQQYDAWGQRVSCPAPASDCEVEPIEASFQDACIDRGYKLAACGCSWACSGDPTQ